MERLTFKASLDALAKGITIGVTLLFAFLVFGPLIFYKDQQTGFIISIGIGLLAIYLFVYGYSPRKYILTTDTLIIKRLFKNVEISRANIQSVGRIEKEKLDGSIRTFGVGGLFGYFGKFVNRKLGKMNWYVTRLDKAVLITTINNKKIILSPDRAEEFITNFNSLESSS